MDNAQLDNLEALARAATPGPWELDTVKSEGHYGTDEDGGYGYTAYVVTDDKGRPLMDSLNRDNSEIHEDTDGDEHYAWDELAKRDAQFIAAANPATVLALIAQARAQQETAAAPELCPYCKRSDGAHDKAFPHPRAASQPPAPVVAADWKMVPLVCTLEMRAAWDRSPQNEDGDIEFHNAYRAMVDAAPTAPETAHADDDVVTLRAKLADVTTKYRAELAKRLIGEVVAEEAHAQQDAAPSDDDIKDIAIDYAQHVAADIFDVTKYDSAEDFFNCVRACIRKFTPAAVASSDATGKDADLTGRIVSVDVSTGDDDYGNRIFAELTGETGSDGTTLLAIETGRNFDATGKADAANAGGLMEPQNVSDERKSFNEYWSNLDDAGATDAELEMCEYAAWQAWQARPRHCLALPLSAYPTGTTYKSATSAADAKDVEQLEARILKLRTALQEISQTRFGWDGDCGVTRIADDALYDDEQAQSSAKGGDAVGGENG